MVHFHKTKLLLKEVDTKYPKSKSIQQSMYNTGPKLLRETWNIIKANTRRISTTTKSARDD